MMLYSWGNACRLQQNYTCHSGSMSRHYRRSASSRKNQSFLKTIHDGFNYFHEIDFSLQKKSSPFFRHRPSRKIILSEKEDHHSLQVLLSENKQKFNRIKTEMSSIRQIQLNDYVKKSLRYQEILNINDTKKKRLPTLNTKIGEVIKKSATESVQKNIQYTMATTVYNLQGWKPESREGHTTTVYKNMAVVIGGHCSTPFSEAQVYSFDKQAWIKQFQLSTARSYHSSIFYKNRFIIIFGGMGVYDISRKCRVCYNTINLVDLQTWSSRTLKMSSEQSIEGRRNHGAALLGKYMLVLGGINTKRQYLNDFVYLDLKELRWYHKEYKIQGKQLNDSMETGLAKHKIVPCFKNTHKNYPLYSSQYSDSQGLLIFGGMFGNGEQNLLLFMGFNKYNPYLRKIDYMGIPASSIDPIVQKVNENTIIILSGQLNERSIKLFRIKERQFIGIYKFQGRQFFGGIGSTLSHYEEENYIFFGLGSAGYIGGVYSFRVQEKIVQAQARKKKQRNNELFEKIDKIQSDSDISKI